MIRFTHYFDALHRMALIFAVVLIILPIIISLFERNIYCGLAAMVLLMLVGMHVLTRTVLPNAIPTYLYLRLWLRVPICWDDAARTTPLFDGSLGRWYPLRVLREVPRESRRQALLDLARPLQEAYELGQKGGPWPTVLGFLDTRALNWAVLVILIYVSYEGWRRMG